MQLFFMWLILSQHFLHSTTPLENNKDFYCEEATAEFFLIENKYLIETAIKFGKIFIIFPKYTFYW